MVNFAFMATATGMVVAATAALVFPMLRKGRSPARSHGTLGWVLAIATVLPIGALAAGLGLGSGFVQAQTPPATAAAAASAPQAALPKVSIKASVESDSRTATLAKGRQALRDDLLRRAIPWIEDPSNAATKYERVRMRRLAARLSDATQARIVGVMDRLAELRSAAAGLAREALANHVHVSPSEAQPSEARLDAAAFRSLSAEARLRLVEALVMAAGHAHFPPEPRRLERLAEGLTLPGGVGAGATLAGAWVRETGADLCFRPAPPRRSAAKEPAPGFSLARATALLGDPRIAAFRV